MSVLRSISFFVFGFEVVYDVVFFFLMWIFWMRVFDFFMLFDIVCLCLFFVFRLNVLVECLVFLKVEIVVWEKVLEDGVGFFCVSWMEVFLLVMIFDIFRRYVFILSLIFFFFCEMG